jgi:hypothetical protein
MWATCLETKNRLSTAPLSHTPSCIRDTMLYPFIVFMRPLHLDMSCWLTYLESSTPRISWASIEDTRLSGRSSSLSCSSMEIQQTSFKVKILFRYSSYRNYLLRYMCIKFLSNRPQADGEWQKLRNHVYTCAMVCSFVSFTYYLIYLRGQIAKKIHLWRCLLHCSFPPNVLYFGMGFGGIPYFIKMDISHVKRLMFHPLDWEWVLHNHSL